MTYQVLARKWRPRSFDSIVGQDHVVRALSHALDTQRLHHAWLFTGTRGVGKTTLARLLAKALNCEQGVSSTPCGQCIACVEIDEGRFVDYVELDAASNRGVDEMTQLLEQATYAPSAARYKVYMIDEVHMLTGHAFNAMLKTLEEPPAHVKFILATTDPQKIPVTVLSRCLQFNLKQMTVPAIEQHLAVVLEQESVETQAPALRLIAQAAQGSMRDALSLTDQAIAYSGGSVSTEAVQSMLGTIDQSYLSQLLFALAQGQGQQLVSIADQLLVRGLSFSGALADLARMLSRIAIQQRVPDALPADEPNAEAITQLAQLLSVDHVQLYYSVVVHSRDELSLAPDEYAGFIMACMRLLALAPAAAPVHAESATTGEPTSATTAATAPAAGSAPVEATVSADPTAKAAPTDPVSAPPAPVPAPTPTKPTVPQAPKAQPVEASAVPAAPHAYESPPWETEVPAQADSTPKAAPTPTRKGIHPPSIERGGQALAAAPQAHEPPPWESNPPDAQEPTDDFNEGDGAYSDPIPPSAAVEQVVAALDLPAKTPTIIQPQHMSATDWVELAPTLALSGWAAELAQQSEWIECDGAQITLRVAIRSADDSQAKARINTVLNEYFGSVLRVHIEYGSTGDDTAYAVAEAQRAQRQQQVEAQAQQDPFVLQVMAQFDAQLVPQSIQAK